MYIYDKEKEPETPTKPVEPETPTKTSEPETPAKTLEPAPYTGDEQNLQLYFIAIALSSAIIICGILYKFVKELKK